MMRIDRRSLLKLSGAGAIAASSGGVAAILASGRAPAYAQGTTIHWLRWNDFVPASDKLLKEQIVPDSEKALGIKLNVRRSTPTKSRSASPRPSNRARVQISSI
jgi:multiple sugar transport system substrate-binding protein